MPAVKDERFLGCDPTGKPTGRLKECVDAGDSESNVLGTGDPDRDPALNGWKDTDVLRAGPSPGRWARDDDGRMGKELGGSMPV